VVESSATAMSLPLLSLVVARKACVAPVHVPVALNVSVEVVTFQSPVPVLADVKPFVSLGTVWRA